MSDSFDRTRLIGVAPPEDNTAAIRGERVPHILKGTATLCCMVRGIRYHDGFARDLHGIPELPQITRALNARAIMSNRIPDMHTLEEFPYCFWHPDVPSEETLRELLTRYQDNALLPYQVGRACAVGGYTDLYRSLGILPDVSIAEEARDNHKPGQAIYQAIMDAPVRYAYMDDYSRCLREKPIPGAHLNGDTCVRSMLDQRFPIPWSECPILPEVVFDITEDERIDVEGILPGDRPVSPETVQLLHCPLPADLPPVDKDLLILMAAWSGNIDRYDRLRRPVWIDGELPCVVRGIYHHPFFAKWWLTQQLLDRDKLYGPVILQAVHARCIMNNDLSWLRRSTPKTELPEMIWFPQPARPETYIELARREPRMVSLAARACMHANYQKAFDQLAWEPDMWLWADARIVSNMYYLACIEEKAAAMGVEDCKEKFLQELDEAEYSEYSWPMAVLSQEYSRFHPNGSQSVILVPELATNHVGFQHPEEATFSSKIGQVLLHACLADESLRPSPAEGKLNLLNIYRGDLPAEFDKDGRIIALHRRPERGSRRTRGSPPKF